MGVRVLDISLVGLALYLVARLARRRSAPLPPGPPGWPLIGNLLDLRTHGPYTALGAMSGKYGPIISLNVLGTQWVVLNSLKASKDLLEKKSAVTSNRPCFAVAGNLVGWDGITAFLQYGDVHRKHRKFFGRHIGTNSSLVTFYPAKEAEARRFVLSVLKNPDDDLMAHCRRSTASLFWKISYGYSVKDDNDPLMDMASKAVQNLSEVTSPGRFIADFVPIMLYVPEWFPGGGFRKDAKRWRKMVNEAVKMPYEFVLEQLAKDDAAPSMTSQSLQEGITAEDEEILKWAAFTMYLGGTDTAPSMLSGFFLAMTMYPEVLKKAQAEMDAVVGNERLPTVEDHDALPYVNAICMELLRWNVLIPWMAHVSTEDIIYEGYLIPKGSWLVANIWFILSNPATYPDPDVFNPERFLGEHRQPDPREACFGWGRRVCSGARLVESVTFIYVAMALATLDVSRYVENGVESVPRYEFEEGIIRHVKPFKCKIALRSTKAEDLLHA